MSLSPATVSRRSLAKADAIAKVKEDGVNDDWKALELICADYMAGA